MCVTDNYANKQLLEGWNGNKKNYEQLWKMSEAQE